MFNNLGGNYGVGRAPTMGSGLVPTASPTINLGEVSSSSTPPVIVGNIAYDATEAEIREVFSQVGPVVNFRLVYDRDTGKPKGYGFCEYVDEQTAESAIRNLNSFEFHGRMLRVDSAAGGNKTAEEIRQLQMTIGGPQEESPYGAPVSDPQKVPEAISKAVASLPPEQMFELMKQMKLCIQNNPNEARTMLLQNPQLAYALLQAQVVMRIVDPQVAMTMLHRDAATDGAAATAAPALLPTVPTAAVSAPTFGGIASLPAYSSLPMLQSSSALTMYSTRPTTMTAQGPPLRPPAAMLPPFAGVSSQQQQPATTQQDQERAELIKQVLELSEEQIALLPADQQQSVRVLREQFRNI